MSWFNFTFKNLMKRAENNVEFLDEHDILNEIEEYLRPRGFIKSAGDDAHIVQETPDVDFVIEEPKKKKQIEVKEIQYGRNNRNNKPGLF